MSCSLSLCHNLSHHNLHTQSNGSMHRCTAWSVACCRSTILTLSSTIYPTMNRLNIKLSFTSSFAAGVAAAVLLLACIFGGTADATEELQFRAPYHPPDPPPDLPPPTDFPQYCKFDPDCYFNGYPDLCCFHGFDMTCPDADPPPCDYPPAWAFMEEDEQDEIQNASVDAGGSINRPGTSVERMAIGQGGTGSHGKGLRGWGEATLRKESCGRTLVPHIPTELLFPNGVFKAYRAKWLIKNNNPSEREVNSWINTLN